MKQGVNIKELFYGLQQQMIASLKAQEFINHPGTKGDVTENNWLTWMKEFLPKRYAAEKAFVIDSEGNESEQIDIVIYDQQYSPIVFHQNNALYITAESVYAVFEVKQNLNKDHLEYAADKIASVRKLTRTSAPIVYSDGKRPSKLLHNIIGGLLTSYSDWAIPYDDVLKEHLLKLDYLHQIDLLCCLDSSSYWIDYSKKDQLPLNKSKEDEILLYMFLKFLLMLQEIGTVPAIELSKYAKAIESF